MFEKLFSPIKIRGLELKNRVILSAMGTHNATDGLDKRGVSDKLIAYHVERAKGGTALNTVEVSSVDPYSAPEGFLSIADDKFIPGFKKLNDAVHAAGGKTCIQLWQGGLAVASDRTCQILLPSDMPLSKDYTCPGITEERLYSVIDAFGKAAKRAVEAGFDCLEFHCAHNYLPHSMLSGGINHRSDSWGGSFENRERFPLECIKAIRANMPSDMPLFMRIDCHDDMLPNGLTIEEVIAFCKDAKKVGVDVLDISRGNILTAATIYEVAPVPVPNGFNVIDAARIRKETGMLTMPCGRINTPELAENILENDQADMVVISRSQLADPEFCNKAKAGKTSSIRYCLGCNQGCYDYFCYALYNVPGFTHISCTRNPAVLEEESMRLVKTSHPKKVMVIGGGIAGIEAATDLALTGNEVSLYEASNELGSQALLSGLTPGKRDFTLATQKAIDYLKELPVKINLNTKVDDKMIAKVNPDAVIVAIGSDPMMSSLPGKENNHVISSIDLFKNHASIKANKAVVIGGSFYAMESALELVSMGIKTTVLAESEKTLEDYGSLRKITTQMALAQGQVEVITKATAKSITAQGVDAVVDGTDKSFEADLVVMAIGNKSNDASTMVNYCKEHNIDCEVVGDCKNVSSILSAIHSAYGAVLALNRK